MSQLQRLSFHSFGCRVIQKFLENGGETEAREFIMQSLVNMSL